MRVVLLLLSVRLCCMLCYMLYVVLNAMSLSRPDINYAVWSQEAAWSFGRKGDPDDPGFKYIRIRSHTNSRHNLANRHSELHVSKPTQRIAC